MGYLSYEEKQKRYKFDPNNPGIIVGKVCANILCTMRSLDSKGYPIPIPIALFDKDARSEDGYGRYCKDCKKEINELHYLLHFCRDVEKFQAAMAKREEQAEARKAKKEEETALRAKLNPELNIKTTQKCANPMCPSKLNMNYQLINPDAELPLSEFGRDKGRSNGRAIYCKECMRDRAKQWLQQKRLQEGR